jgi:hypothetical protein
MTLKKKISAAGVMLAIAVAFTLLGFVSTVQAVQETGYTDTPYIPYGKWRVHDDARPRPAVVTPGSNGSAPSDAVVLFDGTDLSKWEHVKGDERIPATWKMGDGYFETVPRSGPLVSKEKFGDCQLHVEWATPSKVEGDSQGRGNSGVFLMGVYEIQVLDSWNNLTYADGQAGAMYGQYPPLVNSSRGPGEWQSYDIIFEAPEFKDGKMSVPAYITVIHNGIVLHHRQAFHGQTFHKRVGVYTEHPSKGPIALQDHGNPIKYRNIWVRPLGDYDQNVK